MIRANELELDEIVLAEAGEWLQAHGCPETLASRCLNPTVRQLAQAIDHDGNFAQLPILADLLQEAGCDQEDVLQHLRGDAEHVRGCWALDLVLGRS